MMMMTRFNRFKIEWKLMKILLMVVVLEVNFRESTGQSLQDSLQLLGTTAGSLFQGSVQDHLSNLFDALASFVSRLLPSPMGPPSAELEDEEKLMYQIHEYYRK